MYILRGLDVVTSGSRDLMSSSQLSIKVDVKTQWLLLNTVMALCVLALLLARTLLQQTSRILADRPSTER